MSNENSRQVSLPTIAYGTFANFVNRMRHGLPSRVDRSVMQSLSGGTQSQLIGALRFLDLIDVKGKPNELFGELVRADGTDRQRLLRRTIDHSYKFVCGKGFDLERGTRHELEKVFAEQGAAGLRLQKVVAFFLALAEDAALKISIHISDAQERTRGFNRRMRAFRNEAACTTRTSERGRSECFLLLASKLPPLELSWPDELKVRWLDSFDRLVELLKVELPEDADPAPGVDTTLSSSIVNSNEKNGQLAK